MAFPLVWAEVAPVALPRDSAAGATSAQVGRKRAPHGRDPFHAAPSPFRPPPPPFSFWPAPSSLLPALLFQFFSRLRNHPPNRPPHILQQLTIHIRTGRPVLAASACGRLAAYLQSTPSSHALPLWAPLWRRPPLPHPACPLRLYVFIETGAGFRWPSS